MPYHEGLIEGLSEDVQVCLPLSGPLHRYMHWARKTTDAEPIFHLGSILPCWAHLVCSHGFVIDERQRLTPRIWSFMVGVPASAKSTAIKRAMSVYGTVNLQTSRADPFVLAEGSVPGIFEALAERFDADLDQSHGVVHRDEAARLLDTTDSVADMFCQIIDGDTVKRHLRGARAANLAVANSVQDTLRSPTFSGLLATTFSRLREVTKASYLEGGLYSRFLWFVGQPSLGLQSLDVDPHTSESIEVARSWADWSQWAIGQHALGVPLVVQIPESANELLKATLFADLQRHGVRDNKLNATRKRGITQARILAGLFALSQERLVVTDEDMDAAINLVTLCLEGLERIEPTLAMDANSVAHFDQVTRVLSAINSAGAAGLPKSRLYPLLNRSKFVVDGLIETLLAEGSVRLVSVPTGAPGRIPQVLVSTGRTRGAIDPERDEGAEAAHVAAVAAHAARPSARRARTKLDN